MKNQLIICFYVGVGDMDQNDIPAHVESIKKANAQLFTDNGAVAFFVPISGNNSKIECINPVLVTDEESKEIFNTSMERLNKVLQAAEKQSENEKIK